jgi:hypothetical protein
MLFVPDDDEVGALQAAIRAERAKRAEQSKSRRSGGTGRHAGFRFLCLRV